MDSDRFDSGPLIMGIVNLNDDSFSGDGSLDVGRALATANKMAADGAAIIDIGAESARTNRPAITIDEEIGRLVPLIERFNEECRTGPGNPGPWLSINTWRSEVIEKVLPGGRIDMINDIGGLPDPRNAELCAEYNARLVIMHTVGLPKTSHTGQQYDEVLDAMECFFEEKIALATGAGLPPERIILDPGIDFAKQRADNLAIYRHLDRLQRFDLPVLLPISRKTVIGEVLGIEEPAARDAGTIACLVSGLLRGAHIFRVHNVPAAVRALRVLNPLVERAV